MAVPANHPKPVSEILKDSARGDERAAAELLPLVYDQLRAMAAERMRLERPDHTLQPTALVHEAFLKLVGDRNKPWAGQAHFYAAAAEAMRQILSDHARGKGRQKRGGDRRQEPLNLLEVASFEDSEEILALDEAICRLEQQEPDAGQIVRLRFYAGLSVDQTAEALNLAPRTVDRRWQFARAWLYRELHDEHSE
jgi:RNA polymerase sigma factor (TIGR02999 family)